MYCNVPLHRVRKCYCNVYTQSIISVNIHIKHQHKHSNITVQVHHYCTTHDIIEQEFVHDFDDTRYEFTSGTMLMNCYKDSRELSLRAER